MSRTCRHNSESVQILGAPRMWRSAMKDTGEAKFCLHDTSVRLFRGVRLDLTAKSTLNFRTRTPS